MQIAKKITALTLGAMLLLGTVSCQNNKSVEMKIAGETVPEQLYGYIFRTTRDHINQDGLTAWENPDGSVHEENMKKLKDDTEEQLRLMFAPHDLAKENNITFTDEEEKKMQEDWAAILENNGGEEAIAKDLEKDGLTIDLYLNFFQRESYLKNKLTLALFSDQLVKAQHILIAFPEALPEDADDAAKEEFEKQSAETKKQAEAALKRAQAGEDFEALMAELGEDPGMKNDPRGYVFAEGVMVQEFYEGTKALEENEISGLVETSYGYHIIKRLPLDVATMIDNVVMDSAFAEMLGTEIPAALNEKLKEHGATLEVTYGPAFDKLTATSFDWMVVAEEEPAESEAEAGAESGTEAPAESGAEAPAESVASAPAETPAESQEITKSEAESAAN